jgi:hypothetical protein
VIGGVAAGRPSLKYSILCRLPEYAGVHENLSLHVGGRIPVRLQMSNLRVVVTKWGAGIGKSGTGDPVSVKDQRTAVAIAGFHGEIRREFFIFR